MGVLAFVDAAVGPRKPLIIIRAAEAGCPIGGAEPGLPFCASQRRNGLMVVYGPYQGLNKTHSFAFQHSTQEVTDVFHAQDYCTAERSRGAAGRSQLIPCLAA